MKAKTEGYIFLAAFGLCIPAANYLIGNVGTLCVPHGPCVIPVGFGLTAPSGVLMVGLGLCDEAWNALERRGLRPWVHMLRGVALAGDRWPFASADSVNVARNFKNKGEEVCPERMARRIDAVQTPVRWTVRPEQVSLFTAAE
jgi:hypothetical protein